jgi:hypothetical protein
MMKVQCAARYTVPKPARDIDVMRAAKNISVAREASWNIHGNGAL